MSEADATLVIPPIPEGLCGIDQCVFSKNHKGEHTWQK